MADAKGFLQLTYQPNPSLFYSLDPVSLILSQNSTTHELKLTSDAFCAFERGPRYKEYAMLRERKLLSRSNCSNYDDTDSCYKKAPQVEEKELEKEKEKEMVLDEPKFTPEKRKKNVTFGGNLTDSRKGSASSASLVAKSVPDFSAILRKENRKPANVNSLSPVVELTPPSKTKGSRNGGVLGGSASSRGSRSASSAAEKKSFGGLARKSYASVEDLKKISAAAASAINGGGGGGRRIGGVVGGGRTVLGYRQFY